MAEKPHLKNVNTGQWKNNLGQTVAGSAWINTKDQDDPRRQEKIDEVMAKMLANDIKLYIVVKDTNGSVDYSDHTALTNITLFPSDPNYSPKEFQQPQQKEASHDGFSIDEEDPLSI